MSKYQDCIKKLIFIRNELEKIINDNPEQKSLGELSDYIEVELNKYKPVKRMRCKALLRSWVNTPRECSYFAVKNGLCNRHLKMLTPQPYTEDGI